jgi:hypothetical protein
MIVTFDAFAHPTDDVFLARPCDLEIPLHRPRGNLGTLLLCTRSAQLDYFAVGGLEIEEHEVQDDITIEAFAAA